MCLKTILKKILKRFKLIRLRKLHKQHRENLTKKYEEVQEELDQKYGKPHSTFEEKETLATVLDNLNNAGVPWVIEQSLTVDRIDHN